MFQINTVNATKYIFLNLMKKAFQVAQRVVSTQLLMSRLVLELNMPKGKTKNINDRIFNANNSLQTCFQSYSKLFTEKEQYLMSKELGTWTNIEIYNTESTRLESLGILLFVMQLLKHVPSFDSRFDSKLMYSCTNIIPAIPDTISMFLEYYNNSEIDHFVSLVELERIIAISEAYFWRSRAQVIIDLKSSSQDIPSSLKNILLNIDNAVKVASERALTDKLIDEIDCNDFKVLNRPYAKLTDHQVRDLANIASARLAALSWIYGISEWDYNVDELKFITQMGSLWSPQ